MKGKKKCADANKMSFIEGGVFFSWVGTNEDDEYLCPHYISIHLNAPIHVIVIQEPSAVFQQKELFPNVAILFPANEPLSNLLQSSRIFLFQQRAALQLTKQKYLQLSRGVERPTCPSELSVSWTTFLEGRSVEGLYWDTTLKSWTQRLQVEEGEGCLAGKRINNAL